MTKAVLIHEDEGNIEEIDVDIEPSKNEIFKILGGPQTFIGQWPELNVVIMKAENAVVVNENIIPSPFHDEEVMGKILLIRMDVNSEPQDFTVIEYVSFLFGNEGVTA